MHGFIGLLVGLEWLFTSKLGLLSLGTAVLIFLALIGLVSSSAAGVVGSLWFLQIIAWVKDLSYVVFGTHDPTPELRACEQDITLLT